MAFYYIPNICTKQQSDKKFKPTVIQEGVSMFNKARYKMLLGRIWTEEAGWAKKM